MANRGQDFTGFQIPCAPGEFTPECLTAILRRSGVIQQSKVDSVQVQEQSVGLVGQAAHLKLTYDREEPGAPSEIFAKLPSASAEVRAKLSQQRLEQRHEVGVRIHCKPGSARKRSCVKRTSCAPT